MSEGGRLRQCVAPREPAVGRPGPVGRVVGPPSLGVTWPLPTWARAQLAPITARWQQVYRWSQLEDLSVWKVHVSLATAR